MSDIMNPPTWVDTRDIVVGDTIRYEESVFSGPWRSAKYVGKRTIKAKVEGDSYGSGKQQHTFTLRILECSGVSPIDVGKPTRRKGRNIYKYDPVRLLWDDEDARQKVADEKHERGDAARSDRERRREEERMYV